MSPQSPQITRTAFVTSRQLDFVSEKELTMQCGHGPSRWPHVAVKELVDNALDKLEELGIAPEITIDVDTHAITVADNGPGIEPGLVDQLLDFSVRVSSREAYVAPDRGAQGNALKTLVAMPFVLDGERGRIDIVGGGVRNEIEFGVDRVAQRPVADVRRLEKAGSMVRLHWPRQLVTASDDDDEFLQEASFLQDELRQLTEDFAMLNPHLTITISFPTDTLRIEATDPGWEKWRPSSPTSPHWYAPEHIERLIGAYIGHDRQHRNGRPERTVREFVSEFRGLTGTAKQKAVLDATGLARAPLSALIAGRDFDHAKIAGLLEAMQAQAKPVAPRLLGTIGREHIHERFSALGIRDGSFDYKQVVSLDGGLPQVTEVAFAALADETSWRRLVTGVNWSAAWVNPFRQVGSVGQSLDTLLSDRRFEPDRPIVLLVHVAHPRVQYGDRGKSTVVTR